MTILSVVAYVLLIGGFVAAIVSLDRYSTFMTRLRLVEPWRIGDLTFDDTDGYSRKNMLVGQYFWRKEYLNSSDPTLRSLGDSVRQTQLFAVVAIVIGIAVKMIAQ